MCWMKEYHFVELGEKGLTLQVERDNKFRVCQTVVWVHSQQGYLLPLEVPEAATPQ